MVGFRSRRKSPCPTDGEGHESSERAANTANAATNKSCSSSSPNLTHNGCHTASSTKANSGLTGLEQLPQPWARHSRPSLSSSSRIGCHTGSSARANCSEMEQPQPCAQYLSYHDIVLTREDVQYVRHGWLMDNAIGFWEEWLDREVLPNYPKARICLLRPSVAFILLRDPDIASVRSALPNFDQVTHIFIPVNDERNVQQAEGGNHWSLLLVSVIDCVAFHYDSLGGANFDEARTATNKLSRVLGKDVRFQQASDCPQQSNSMDCGVFVCIIMRHLLIKRLLNASANEKVSMSMEGKYIDAQHGRHEMMAIINSRREAHQAPNVDRPRGLGGGGDDVLLERERSRASGKENERQACKKTNK